MAISINPLELWVPHVHTQTHMVVSYNGGTPKPWISIWYTKIVWVWIPLFSETPTSPMRCYAFSLPSHPVVLHPADLCKLCPRRHWPSHQVKLAQKWNMSYVLYIILYYIMLYYIILYIYVILYIILYILYYIIYYILHIIYYTLYLIYYILYIIYYILYIIYYILYYVYIYIIIYYILYNIYYILYYIYIIICVVEIVIIIIAL